jgi:CheY-like chemotaxis protein
VRVPTEQGFGTKIINATVKHQIGGDVTLDWHAHGLHCTLSIPAGGNVKPDGPPAQKPDNLIKLESGSRKRVMLVEDEALVGMMMRDMLSDLGYFVVGPFCSLAEAQGALEGRQYDCAILDLNLRGDLVYPIANSLDQSGTPYLFVTGYGPESTEARYAHVPVLQKPIARDSLDAALRGLLGLKGAAQPNPEVFTQPAAQRSDTASRA